jgi:hypothetical protein
MKAMLDPRIATTRIHDSAEVARRTAGLPDSITALSLGGFTAATTEVFEAMASNPEGTQRGDDASVPDMAG